MKWYDWILFILFGPILLPMLGLSYILSLGFKIIDILINNE